MGGVCYQLQHVTVTVRRRMSETGESNSSVGNFYSKSGFVSLSLFFFNAVDLSFTDSHTLLISHVQGWGLVVMEPIPVVLR